MVPTLAIGFNDIEKRMEAQNLLSQAHKAKLQEINEKVKKLQETTLLENANKLMEAKRQYMEITQRVIRVREKKKRGEGICYQVCMILTLSIFFFFIYPIVPQAYPSFTAKRTIHYP